MLLKRKGVQRIAAAILSIAVLGSGFPISANTVIAAGEKAEVQSEMHCENQETKSYIITTEEKEDFQELAEEYDASTDDQSKEELEDVKTFTAELSEKEVRELKQDNRVELVEEDICVQGSASAGENRVQKAARKEKKETEGPEWNIDILNLENGGRKSADAKIRVAVIDSGVDENEDIEVTERKTSSRGRRGFLLYMRTVPDTAPVSPALLQRKRTKPV